VVTRKRNGMPDPDAALMTLTRAIVAGDAAAVTKLLAKNPALAAARFEKGATRRIAKAYFIDAIANADVRAKNRRGAEPLHSAAAGQPGSHAWNPRAQAATIACLIAAGADPNALNKDGVAPLHVAVRTRSAAAVQALLDGGADPRRKNKSGSTPMRLATLTTGRSGSGSPEAKTQQAQIAQLLEQYIERA
jgi:ankyrin repeat protein